MRASRSIKAKQQPTLSSLFLPMRQLAAIMFSDMSGYTALMQQNEQLAKVKHRRLKEVLEVSVSAHHGKILQYYGDGASSIFNSAIDGVDCAVEIQHALLQDPKV